MPDLRFELAGVKPLARAATPHLAFQVRLRNLVPDERVHSLALRCQVQIEPIRRRYTAAEQARLTGLFGAPENWSHSLHALFWAQLSLNLPGFTGETVVELPVPCTFDFNVSLTRYFDGLEQGDIPISLLFSGTVYYAAAAGLQVAQIPWDRDAGGRFPVQVWKELMELYYPGAGWLCLRRDVFDRMLEFRARNGLTSWEQTVERMLDAVCEPQP